MGQLWQGFPSRNDRHSPVQGQTRRRSRFWPWITTGASRQTPVSTLTVDFGTSSLAASSLIILRPCSWSLYRLSDVLANSVKVPPCRQAQPEGYARRHGFDASLELGVSFARRILGVLCAVMSVDSRPLGLIPTHLDEDFTAACPKLETSDG